MTRGRKTESLVESQARFHEIQQSLNLPESPEAAAGEPWLTISRQVGSGGTEIARLLGQILGWQIYDREIIAEVAERTDAPESLLEQRDEQATSRMDGYLSFFRSTVDPGQVRFLCEMRETIGRIAGKGKAVILGRGANWILREGHGLRVRIIAPLDQRIARVAEREDLSATQARERIMDTDASQQAFIHQAYGADIEDPSGYDLIINSGRIGIEAAAALLAGLMSQMSGEEDAG